MSTPNTPPPPLFKLGQLSARTGKIHNNRNNFPAYKGHLFFFLFNLMALHIHNQSSAHAHTPLLYLSLMHTPPPPLLQIAASILNTSCSLPLSIHHESPGYFHCAKKKQVLCFGFSECTSSFVQADTQHNSSLQCYF